MNLMANGSNRRSSSRAKAITLTHIYFPLAYKAKGLGKLLGMPVREPELSYGGKIRSTLR